MRVGGKFVWLGLVAVVLQLAQAPPARAGTSYIKAFNTAGALQSAAGITTDDLGNVYVADTAAYRIVKFDKDGNPLIAFGQGSYDTQGEAGHLYYPSSVTFANGVLYVTDAADHVNVFSTNGDSMGQWGAPGGGPAQLNGPLSLTSDCSGNIYVANSRNGRIDEYDGNGTPIKTFGTGDLAVPSGIAIDQVSNGSTCVIASIYVADEYNNNIVQFAGNGEKIATIGEAGQGPLQFLGPEELALDHEAGTPNYTLWVAESGTFRAQQLVSADGGGHWKYGGEIRSGADTLGDTHGLTLTPNGNLLVDNTGGVIYEYADRAPALEVSNLSLRRQIRNTQELHYDLKYNQLDKTCNVVLTVEVDAPHHTFTLKQHVPGVGSTFKLVHLELSDNQLGFVEKAWKANHKVPAHAKAVGSCSGGVHVTQHKDSKTI